MSGVVAFITPEMGIDQSLHTYSGGLGFLGGEFLRSAYAMEKPFVAVSLLARCGYYDQHIEHSRMSIGYTPRPYDDILESTGVKFTIPICKSPVWIEVKKLAAGKFQNAECYFLDCDIEENNRESRDSTLYLYGGSHATGSNMERIIAQSIILGRGAVEAFKHLNIPVALYHLNESHAAFAGVALVDEFLRVGISLEQAIAAVREKIVFSTHTPVSAGNPRYPLYTEDGRNCVEFLWGCDDVVTRNVLEQIGGSPFNMAACCIRLAKRVNAVSLRHLEIARDMWHWVRDDINMTHVTNGVNRNFWQLPEFSDATTPHDMRKAKRLHKRKLLGFIAETTGKYFGEYCPIVCWARRFAEYKRPKLLFYDYPWIADLLRRNTIQLVIAGKPHPDDFGMIAVWNELLAISHHEPNMVVLPGYEMEMSKLLKAGADIWLNTPRAPLEACGTSGMSATMNGAIHMSTPDGWAFEENPLYAFLFGTRYPLVDQDAFDLQELKKVMHRAIEMYYDAPDEWYAMALGTKQKSEMQRTSDRMLTEYWDRLYFPCVG